MRVLVLDGNQNQAVASVRSLAKAGHTVLVGESRPWSKAGWSRFCSGSFQYPNPERNLDRFVSRISEFAEQQSGTLILPMTEATTLPLSDKRHMFESAGAKLVLPSHADVLRAFNKDETVRLAASLGIAVPRTVAVCNADHAREAASTLNFPVVLKPSRSVESHTSGAVRITGRPRYARNVEELQARYQELTRVCSQVLVQDFIDGEGAGYFALMRQGQLRAEFAHRRIRDVYPTGSGSALRMSLEPDSQIRLASLAILEALNWHGVAMVEFRQKAGQPPVFMEVNGRFWNSLPLACYAGVDFPALLAEMAEAGDLKKQNGYRTGTLCRWFLGDFRHLIEVWRGAPPGYPRSYPGKLRTFLDVVTPVPGTFHDNFQWRDPLPELGDWLSFFQRAIDRAKS